MLVNPSDVVARAKATITECSVRDAHDCLDSGTLLIDIREPAEFQQAARRVNGTRKMAAKTLEDLGYKKVVSMDGGIVAWAQAQMPIVMP